MPIVSLLACFGNEHRHNAMLDVVAETLGLPTSDIHMIGVARPARLATPPPPIHDSHSCVAQTRNVFWERTLHISSRLTTCHHTTTPHHTARWLQVSAQQTHRHQARSIVAILLWSSRLFSSVPPLQNTWRSAPLTLERRHLSSPT